MENIEVSNQFIYSDFEQEDLEEHKIKTVPNGVNQSLIFDNKLSYDKGNVQKISFVQTGKYDGII